MLCLQWDIQEQTEEWWLNHGLMNFLSCIVILLSKIAVHKIELFIKTCYFRSLFILCVYVYLWVCVVYVHICMKVCSLESVWKPARAPGVKCPT